MQKFRIKTITVTNIRYLHGTVTNTKIVNLHSSVDNYNYYYKGMCLLKQHYYAPTNGLEPHPQTTPHTT